MVGGFFITFEGGEGVGKTTQIKYLESALKEQGYDVVVTREPGGTPAAEDIRNLIFNPKHDESWTVEAETLMMFAARSMHIKEVIAPALTAGKVVLCDRYMDSTRVYQGVVKGVDMSLIQALEDNIIGDIIPNLTFILDLEASVAMARVQGRGAENHHDRGSVEFYERLRQGFLGIAQDNDYKNNGRCAIVDASQNEEIIAAAIIKVVEEKLK